MAKKQALKFGKHGRLDWKSHVNKMREAIKTDYKSMRPFLLSFQKS